MVRMGAWCFIKNMPSYLIIYFDFFSGDGGWFVCFFLYFFYNKRHIFEIHHGLSATPEVKTSICRNSVNVDIEVKSPSKKATWKIESMCHAETVASWIL